MSVSFQRYNKDETGIANYLAIQQEINPFLKQSENFDFEKSLPILDSNKPSLLSKHIFNVFSSEHPQEIISCRQRASNIIASAVSISCGYISWYPMIIGVMDTSINSKLVKVILAGGSWAAYGGLYAWGTLKITEGLFKKRTPTEAALFRNKKHPCLSSIYKANVLVLGFCACLPNAYFSYTFNKKSVPWAAINIAGSWGISTYPIHNMFQEFQVCSKSFFTKPLWNEIRSFFILRLKYLTEKIPDMDTTSLSELFNCDIEISNEGNTESIEYAKIFFQKIVEQYSEEAEQHNKLNTFLNKKIVQYPVKCLSVILPTSNIYANGKATYLLVNQFTDSTPLKLAITALALTPSYLEYSLNRDCLLLIIKQIAKKILGIPPKTISGTYHPKTYKLFLFTAIILSLLSSSIDYVTAREIFDEDTELDSLAVLASVINSLALTLLPMIALSIALLDKGNLIAGNSEINAKLEKSQKIEELITVIENCKQDEFIAFIDTMLENPKIKQELIEKFPWLSSRLTEF